MAINREGGRFEEKEEDNSVWINIYHTARVMLRRYKDTGGKCKGRHRRKKPCNLHP